jgi:hypothetical protein
MLQKRQPELDPLQTQVELLELSFDVHEQPSTPLRPIAVSPITLTSDRWRHDVLCFERIVKNCQRSGV